MRACATATTIWREVSGRHVAASCSVPTSAGGRAPVIVSFMDVRWDQAAKLYQTT